MSAPEPPDPKPEPAEARLSQLLQTLRDDPPEPTHSLALMVVQRARWQGGVRTVIRVVSQFAAAAGGIARLLIGRRA